MDPGALLTGCFLLPLPNVLSLFNFHFHSTELFISLQGFYGACYYGIQMPHKHLFAQLPGEIPKKKKKKNVFLILQLEGQAVALPQENGEADLCQKGAARARVAAGCPIPQG